ncbi:MAG: ABC transporter permease [Firmicutes bacterium]|nr:ABC transporter permease [Bacillota bacterium]MCM1402075.1 ABC transporter permease [Bacteroides sp.]MCM1477998.1 ABC transporter permease [Bacteroides sp.]
MFDLFREIFQSLSNNKVRTFLTGLAVAWGIFMLIVLLGMSRGVTNSFTSRVTVDNARSLNVYGGFTAKPYKGYKEGRKIEPEASDIQAITKENKQHVEHVTAAKTLDSAVVSTAKDYVSDQIYGHFPSELQKARLKMTQGRFLNNPDLEQRRRVIVLNEQNANALFGNGVQAVGRRVNALGLSWLVVGVYSHDWERSSYIPYTTAMMLAGNNGKVSELFVKIKNVRTDADGLTVEQDVRESLSKTHDFDPADDSAVHIWNRFVSYLTQMKAMSILNVAVWLIGIFTLLSGIVGVSNIMFVSVRERKHEIGIRRAIGAKPRSILVQVVAESIAITTLFGYIGVFFGMLVTGTIDYLTRNTEFLKNPTVDLSIALKVTVVLIIAGAFAGLFPAMKATKVKPVEALRDE